MSEPIGHTLHLTEAERQALTNLLLAYRGSSTELAIVLQKVEAKESAIDVISRVTGLSKETMQDIWTQVRANRKLLDECKGHDFSLPFDKRGEMVVKWKCSKCGGTVDTSDKRWYEAGLKHGLTRG